MTVSTRTSTPCEYRIQWSTDPDSERLGICWMLMAIPPMIPEDFDAAVHHGALRRR